MPPAAQRRTARSRRGITLLEVMVAVGIVLLMTVILVPSLSAVLMLEQRNAARKLALVYESLQHEAILRNRTFRVVYNLTEGTWHVEHGDAGATVFSTSKAREEFEDDVRGEDFDRLSSDQQDIVRRQASFQQVGTVGTVKLPDGTVFKSVYTPQYDEPVERGERHDDDDGPQIVYSHVFADGTAEYTVVQIVDEEDDDEGFTISVDPLSGRVEMVGELLDQHDRWAFLPDEGPDLD
ncbi:MAG: type II secretion system protein [Alphaproteobacteria bacterium]|nr:type II secretion system protein [Alphaproteobacteria bacterium]